MKTEEYLLKDRLSIDISKIELPKIEQSEIEIIDEYIEFTRHFQEINQLFHIFQVNMKQLILHYELLEDDTIIKKDKFDIEESDEIIINALFINYISSAKTFIESIEVFLKKRLGEIEYQNYKNIYLSPIYDKEFSYKFLYSLRNYSQHGHLPVHVDFNNKCSFDLNELLNTPHFDHNAKLKVELNEIRECIIKEFKDNPRIMFTRTIAEFQIVIFEIYELFINYIFERLIFLKNKINKYIEKNPNIIYKSNDMFDGYIMYKIKDKNVHCFNPNDDPVEMMENIRENVIFKLNDLRNEFDNIFKMKKIKEARYKKKYK